MLIRHFMTRQVITLPAELSCAEAWERFGESGLRRAPVERDSRVIGMVTDRDLARVLPWTIGDLEREERRRRQELEVGRLCRRALVSVGPDAHLEAAAASMLENKIGGLPVIESGRLVGIITESDLFKAFLRLKPDLDAVRLSLHWPHDRGAVLDPGPLAVSCGVELVEFLRHPGTSGGVLVDLRVSGRGVDLLLARLLSAGFLLLDREEPAGRGGAR